MHRSITLSEIVSSTFSNNAEETKVPISKTQKITARLGIGLAEFLVCSLYQCYGILLAQYIGLREYPLEQAAWTTLTYLAAWHITDPGAQFLMKHLERKGYFHYKIIISISTVLLSTGIIFSPHYLCYGIFGGVFSNIIYTHLKSIAKKKMKTTERAFEGNIQSARAISLLIMPHIVLLLVSTFATNRATMIYSAVILNIIPAVLIIRMPEEDDKEFSFIGTSRYQTLPAFAQQMREMKVFASSGEINYSGLSVTEYNMPSYNDEENEEDDDLLVHEKSMNHHENASHDSTHLVPQLTPYTVQMYYSQAGVSILPEIPEEEEAEESNLNVIDSKRLSRISTALEELNSKERRENLKEFVVTKEVLAQPEKIEKIEYIANYTENKNRFIKEMTYTKEKICCSCSPYTMFVWKRRMRASKHFLIDYLFVPIFRALRNLHFYPTLFSKVSMAVSSILFLCLTPYMALKKNDGYRREDMAFLLSYIAFSWCLSLILLPLLMRFSPVKLRISFIVGLVLSSCSMLLLTKRKMTNDFITWSALLFGFGYGLARFAENLVYRSFAGKRQYAQFEATLNTLTGLIVILINYLLYINEVDLVAWFPITSSICYVLNAAIWVIAPFVKEVLIFLTKYFKQKNNSDSIL